MKKDKVDAQDLLVKKSWLILSHGFNMDGRASSQTITDKMPYLLEAGIKPIVFSADRKSNV